MNNLYRLVILVSLSSTGATASRFAVLVSASQQDASAATVGLLAGLFTGVGMFIAVPTGRLVDRIGTRTPLIAGTVLLALSVCLGIFTRSLPALFAIAIFSGLAHNVMIIAFQKLAGDLAPPDARAESFGMLSFGFSISILAAPVVAGFAIDHLGFTATFVLFSVVPLASLALSSSKFLPWPAATGVAGAGTAARARGGIRELLADPNLRKLWIGCAVFEGAWAAFSFLLPLYGTRLGLSASTLGLIAGTAGFTLFVVRALMTPLLRRFTPWQLIIIGMVLVGAGHGLLAGVTVPLWMAVGAGLLGVGQGLCSPMVNAQIYESAAAERKGESLALRAFISTGAQGAVPVLAGPLSALITIPGVFVLVTLASLGSALYSRVEWRHRRRSPRGA